MKDCALTAALLLRDTGLLKEIFGNDAGGLDLGRNIWENVKTMGEFVYLLSKNLVDNPAEFYKHNLKGDIDTYKEIKALQMAFDAGEATNLIEARSVAHNMYITSPQSLQSQILPDVIKTAANELLQGKYPKTINELAVNGNDLMELGLKDKEIGNMQKSLLLKVYANNVRNNREDLLNLTNQNKSSLKEQRPNFAYQVTSSLYEVYPEDRYLIGAEQLKINYLVKKYDEWNKNNKNYLDPTRAIVLEFLQKNYPDLVNDEEIKKNLYWKLIDREVLNEDGEMMKISYSAVVLDKLSQQKLVGVFKPMIPKDWEIIADHMTIKMGALENGSQAKEDMNNGTTITLNVKDYAINDMVMAVRVEGYETQNAIQHITLAVNRKAGAKPVMANKLTDWKELIFPLVLTGKVTEVNFK